jgi:PAP2 superfamily
MKPRLEDSRLAAAGPGLVCKSLVRSLVRPLTVATTRADSLKLEVSVLVALYAVYEVVRGVRNLDVPLAREHAGRIVALERSLHVFSELSVQRLCERIPVLSDVLAYLYPLLHIGVTLGVLYWLYRRRPRTFPVVRTALVLTTGLALVGYIAYPVAPPRLAVPGALDVVSRDSPFDLSSKLLGRFYNPVAAFPSLHFAYALLFGFAVVFLAGSRTARAAGAVYPLVGLLVIVATGNHFFFDAFSGAAVTLTAVGVSLPIAGRELTRTWVSGEPLPGRARSVRRDTFASSLAKCSHEPARLESTTGRYIR